jgi:hypothetical protein
VDQENMVWLPDNFKDPAEVCDHEFQIDSPHYVFLSSHIHLIVTGANKWRV